jgi:para-aminobenzoate synthetase/4-amino-4-deoxychorismate lyase
MIVDMLRNDLGHIAEVGSVRVPHLFEVERYPTVWQMTSTVTASSRASITQIISALFPCASITGAPKPRTTRIIAELETTPRRIYTGCIGFIAPGQQAQFNVAIRTLLIDRTTGIAEYGIGGGIVWDSTPEGEYEECQIKARLLTDVRPEFSLLESLLWSSEGGYFLLDYHLRRLSASADYFNYPFDLARIRAELDKLVAGLPPIAHKVRLLLARAGTVTCQATPLEDIPKPAIARVKLAHVPVNSRDVFLYHKTTARQAYQAAESGCSDCDEVLLWNERGELTETTSANIVMELDGERLTPPVSSGLLAGTYRAWMLDQGLVQERVIPIEDLERCTRIHLVNSIRKQRNVRFIK